MTWSSRSNGLPTPERVPSFGFLTDTSGIDPSQRAPAREPGGGQQSESHDCGDSRRRFRRVCPRSRRSTGLAGSGRSGWRGPRLIPGQANWHTRRAARFSRFAARRAHDDTGRGRVARPPVPVKGLTRRREDQHQSRGDYPVRPKCLDFPHSVISSLSANSANSQQSHFKLARHSQPLSRGSYSGKLALSMPVISSVMIRESLRTGQPINRKSEVKVSGSGK